jgi:hypothetical protein
MIVVMGLHGILLGYILNVIVFINRFVLAAHFALHHWFDVGFLGATMLNLKLKL